MVSDDQCCKPVYFDTPLLVIFERCYGELSLIGSTSFGFAQNTLHDFSNTVLNS